ncbi:MAG: hypothetical protein ACTHM9_04500 [Gemmatimonadales bacterium]
MPAPAVPDPATGGECGPAGRAGAAGTAGGGKLAGRAATGIGSRAGALAGGIGACVNGIGDGLEAAGAPGVAAPGVTAGVRPGTLLPKSKLVGAAGGCVGTTVADGGTDALHARAPAFVGPVGAGAGGAAPDAMAALPDP